MSEIIDTKQAMALASAENKQARVEKLGRGCVRDEGEGKYMMIWREAEVKAHLSHASGMPDVRGSANINQAVTLFTVRDYLY